MHNATCALGIAGLALVLVVSPAAARGPTFSGGGGGGSTGGGAGHGNAGGAVRGLERAELQVIEWLTTTSAKRAA